jgi:hypothetical protein
MFGAGDLVSSPLRGLIPRCINTLFDSLKHADCEEVTVKLAFFEIYNEVVRDLLNPATNSRLKIRERPDESVFVEGLTEMYVTKVSDVYALLKVGDANRAVSATEMNAASSRAHSLLVITVKQTSADGIIRTGVLNFAGIDFILLYAYLSVFHFVCRVTRLGWIRKSQKDWCNRSNIGRGQENQSVFRRSGTLYLCSGH